MSVTSDSGGDLRVPRSANSRHPKHGRTLACITPLWLLVGCLPALASAQDVVRLTPSENCLDCRIELTREIVLRGGAEELGGVSAPLFVAQDGRGRFLLTSGHSPSTLQVLDSTGALLTTFGRPGDGPREFQRINTLVVGPGDTLHVFDAQARTYTVIAPEHQSDYEIVRRVRLGAQVFQAALLDGEHLVLNADIRDGERFGYPLHLIEGDSLGPTIGPADPLEGRIRPEPSGVRRALFPQGDDTFYAAQVPNYVIDHWRVSGTRLNQFVVESPWFDKEDLATPRGRGNPLIQDLTVDEHERLWILASTRSRRFDELAFVTGYHPVASGEEIPVVESRTGDLEDLRDGILEVLDLERGEVLATLRHPATFRGFIGTDRAWSYEEDASGGRITIWRIELVAG